MRDFPLLLITTHTCAISVLMTNLPSHVGKGGSKGIEFRRFSSIDLGKSSCIGWIITIVINRVQQVEFHFQETELYILKDKVTGNFYCHHSIL